MSFSYVVISRDKQPFKSEYEYTTTGKALLAAYVDMRDDGGSVKLINNAKRTGKTYSYNEVQAYVLKPVKKPAVKKNNPLPPREKILRFNDLIATIGENAGRTFLVLKRKGERKALFDQYLTLAAIAEKLRGLGFDVGSLRASNPIDIEPFTAAQLDKLKQKWANAGMPSVVSPAYLKTEKYLENLPTENLRQIKNAKIRVLGVMANMILRDKRGTNPVPEGKLSKLKKATALYENFRDQPGTEILDLPQPDFSAGLVIGRLSAVEYDTVRAGKREDYRHKFKKSAQPLLCVTACGKYLFTVNGNFTFTERGIVDN